MIYSLKPFVKRKTLLDLSHYLYTCVWHSVILLCVFSSPISGMMILRIPVLDFIIITKSEVCPICHCLGWGHETMVCAVCLSIFLLRGVYYHLNQLMFFTSRIIEDYYTFLILSNWSIVYIIENHEMLTFEWISYWYCHCKKRVFAQHIQWLFCLKRSSSQSFYASM